MTSQYTVSNVVLIQIDDYRRNGRESWDAAWSLLHSTDWKVEAGTDLIDGVVYAKNIPKHGKVFMLQVMPYVTRTNFFFSGECVAALGKYTTITSTKQ